MEIFVNMRVLRYICRKMYNKDYEKKCEIVLDKLRYKIFVQA